MSEGISNTGNQVEEEFRRVTGATRTTRAADGDAVLNGAFIEVKKASSNTLNQVRAVKFITLVAFDSRDDTWYVVPAPHVARLVSTRSRGQHTENPFESATLNIRALQEFRTSKAELKEAVLAAIRLAEDHPQLRAALANVLEESRRLAETSRAKIRALVLNL